MEEDDKLQFIVVQRVNSREKWKHLIQDKQLHISRGNKVVIVLEDVDIMRMLKSLGIATRDFQSGFDFENKE